jgi:oxygen-independent coproporphyrinogen-3 oxidase
MTQHPASSFQPALYLHVPFCAARCAYCDFNTYAGLEAHFEPYTAALAQEIRRTGESAGRPSARTLFVGGGTPTVLPVPLMAQALEACFAAFDLDPAAEITCEANPGTTDRARFSALRTLGINRLSLGVQSFDDAELRWLGRIHTALEAERAFAQARAAGFDNINLDLIFGMPGDEKQEAGNWKLETGDAHHAPRTTHHAPRNWKQAAETWQRTLERAVALSPEHLSLYSLTVEPNTPLGRQVRRGLAPQLDDDLAADLYQLACDLLASHGYVHYEISNWARSAVSRQPSANSDQPSAMHQPPAAPDIRHPASSFQPPVSTIQLPASSFPHCRHNLTYWRCEPYLGFGAGAHSYDGARRWWNVRRVPRYIERVKGGRAPRAGGEHIGRRLAMAETIMLGLRLLEEGVPDERFRARFGVDLEQAFGAEIGRLAALGLLERLPDRLRLAPAGWLLGNRVFAEFMPS